MNIHKLNVKPKTIPPKTIPPKTIHWRPLREVKYPALKVIRLLGKFLVKKVLILTRRKLNNYD